VRAKTSSTPCDQAIFADQATDASVSSDMVLLKIDRLGAACGCRKRMLAGRMRR
jgi:hypothetical protein